MGNPFFNALGGGMPAMPGPMGRVMTVMNDLPKLTQLFQSFQAGFNGNAEQMVRGMLSSGKMSQQQFNQYMQAARNFQQMTGIR